MRFVLLLSAFVLLFTFGTLGQELDREEKIRRVNELNRQVKTLEDEILLPAVSDLKEAKSKGLSVFRLMPREKYDHKLTVRGGGAFYSFTELSHDYQKTAQIALEQNMLQVGFAGADYGLMADLGAIDIDAVGPETAEVLPLLDYRPPTQMQLVRAEQTRSRSYEMAKINYQNRVAAKIGNVYVLRSISFDKADVLVAFKIRSQDPDGSIIVFWKLIESFPKPVIDR